MGQRLDQALAARLHVIESASRAELNALFEAEFGRKPATRTSQSFLWQNLAWAAQARAAGENPCRQRQQIMKALDRHLRGKPTRGYLPYRPGTRLIREWQGTVYEVTN